MNSGAQQKTLFQKEKDTNDVIDNSLKNNNVDPEHLLLGTREQSVAGTAPWSGTYIQSGKNVQDSLRKDSDTQKAKQTG